MLTLKAYAKINWYLDAVDKKENGYHILDMVIQSINIYDELRFSKNQENNIILHIENMKAENTSQNLVYKTVELLKKTCHIKKGIKIYLNKNIPIGSGLGGGSANAAATIIALNKIWKLNLTPKRMMDIGLKIGSDVPFCLIGGLAHVRGIGEIIENYSLSREYPLIIIMPDKALSTERVFRDFSIKEYLRNKKTKPKQAKILIKAIQEGNKNFISHYVTNALKNTSVKHCPNIEYAYKNLEEQGAYCFSMTGSGSAVFGVFHSEKDAKKAYLNLKKNWRKCFLTKTVSQGVEIL